MVLSSTNKTCRYKPSILQSNTLHLVAVNSYSWSRHSCHDQQINACFSCKRFQTSHKQSANPDLIIFVRSFGDSKSGSNHAFNAVTPSRRKQLSSSLSSFLMVPSSLHLNYNVWINCSMTKSIFTYYYYLVLPQLFDYLTPTIAKCFSLIQKWWLSRGRNV